MDAQVGATDAAAGEDGAAIDAQESEIFVPPSPGQDPYQAILRQNPTNAALNVAVEVKAHATLYLRRPTVGLEQRNDRMG